MTTTKKTLQRFPKQGQISGVCAGLADYFDLDVTLVRLIFVVLAFATGGGMVLLYIIMSIVVPSADDPKAQKSSTNETKSTEDKFSENVEKLGQELQDNGGLNTARNYAGLGLVALGMWLLLAQFFPNFLALRWEYIWPVLLIFAGFLIITRRKD